MSDELVNDPRPLLPQGRWFRVLVVLVGLVALGVYGWRATPWRSSPDPVQALPPPVARGASVAAPHNDLTAGLFIEGRRPDYTVRSVSTAGGDAHVVVLRDRLRGSFGHRAAAVVYPFEGADGRRTDRRRELVVRVNNGTALVRGDLPRTQLRRIARAIRVDGSHPIVGALPGLTQAHAGPYGNCELLESWYRSEDLGFDRWFGDGYVYTILTDCGGLEDALLAAGATVGPNVYARPSAVSTVLGGNATLSWELAPGLMGVVGYQGRPSTPERIDVLTSIAKETRTYGAAQWDSTHPVTQHWEPRAPWLP